MEPSLLVTKNAAEITLECPLKAFHDVVLRTQNYWMPERFVTCCAGTAAFSRPLCGWQALFLTRIPALWLTPSISCRRAVNQWKSRWLSFAAPASPSCAPFAVWKSNMQQDAISPQQPSGKRRAGLSQGPSNRSPSKKVKHSHHFSLEPARHNASQRPMH